MENSTATVAPINTYEGLKNDSLAMDAMRYSLNAFGVEAPNDPDEILSAFMKHRRYMDVNSFSTINAYKKVTDFNDTQKKIYGFAMQEADKLPSVFEEGSAPVSDVIKDYGLAAITDPVNLLGAVTSAYTLGATGSALLAARVTAQATFRSLLKAKGAALISKPILKSLAAETAVTGVGAAGQNVARQGIDVEIGNQEEIDPVKAAGMGLLEGASGTAAGVLFNVTGSMLRHGGAKILEKAGAAEMLKRNLLPTAGLDDITRRTQDRVLGSVAQPIDEAWELQRSFKKNIEKTFGKKETQLDASELELVNKALEGDNEARLILNSRNPEILNDLNKFKALREESHKYGMESAIADDKKSVYGYTPSTGKYASREKANYVKSVPEAYYAAKRSKNFAKFIKDNPTIRDEYIEALRLNKMSSSVRYDQQTNSFQKVASNPEMDRVADRIFDEDGELLFSAAKTNEIINKEMKELYKPTLKKRKEHGAFEAREDLSEPVKKIIGMDILPSARITETINGILAPAARANMVRDIGADGIRRGTVINIADVADEAAARKAASIAFDGEEAVKLVDVFKGKKGSGPSPFEMAAGFAGKDIDGLYVKPAYAAQLKEMFSETPFGESFLYGEKSLSALYRGILGAQAFAKAGKTVYSPVAMSRNFTSAAGAMVLSGNTRALAGTAGRWLKGEGLLPRSQLSGMWDDFVRRGLRDSSVELKQVTRRFKDITSETDDATFAHKFLNLGGVGEGARKLYQATDDEFKFLTYLNEYETTKKLFDGFSPQQQAEILRDYRQKYNMTGAQTSPEGARYWNTSDLKEDYFKEIAATNTANVMPMYGRVPKLLEKMRTVPVLGSFTAYAAERLRNTHNILKLGTDEIATGFATGNKALTKRGVSRLGQWYTGQMALYGVAYGITEANGYGDLLSEMREAGMMADWKRDHALAITDFNKETGEVSFWDASYINPDQGIADAIIPLILKASNGGDVSKDLDEHMLKAIEGIFDPYVQKSLVLQASLDIGKYVTGEDKSGNALISAYKMMEPGFVKFTRENAMRTGALDNVSPTLYKADKALSPRAFGKEPDRSKSIFEWFLGTGIPFGVKNETMNVKTLTGYALSDLSRNADTNWSVFLRDVKETLSDPSSTYDPDAIAEKYREALAEQFEAQKGIRKVYQSTSNIVGRDSGIKMLRSSELGRAKFTKAELGAALSGRFNNQSKNLSQNKQFWQDIQTNIREKTGVNILQSEIMPLKMRFLAIEREFNQRSLLEDPPE